MSTFTPSLWLNGLVRERDWLRERRDALCPLLPTALLTAGLALVFAHYLFLVTGYTGPDGLCEGLLWATNLSWNVRLGRWLMAWTRQASLSIVMPALFFAANTLGIALASLLLADLWQLRSRWFVAWTCIAFAVAPALVWQALVVHLTLSFALSMLLAVATVWLAFCQPSPFRFVLAVICMAFSMGGYQAYVGIAAGLTLLSVMLACRAERSTSASQSWNSCAITQQWPTTAVPTRSAWGRALRSCAPRWHTPMAISSVILKWRPATSAHGSGGCWY